jgi:hypothetical protein
MQPMDLSNLGQQSGAQPDLSKTTALECKCGGQFFSPGIHFRKESALANANGQEQVIPVEVYLCIDCGDVFEDLLPKSLRPDNGQN